MIISPHESYAAKKQKLALVPPSRQMAVLDQLSRGETVDVTTEADIKSDPFVPALTELLKTGKVDLTKHEDLYFLVNRRLLPLQHMLKRKSYDVYRKEAAKMRKLNQENNGFTDGHTMRHIAVFPPDFYQAVCERYPDGKERDLVIKWILKTEEGKPFATVEKGI